ncbi:aldo/keto reductase [Pseudacidovorax intermedius]|uniref:Aryl-alcohol dehydrogenase-like predicted oxidoreductase n=1 Tax=Pseudacidovorax intermedius TaxID=433924 RepID=A0A370F5J5_9BURK|nr:aldo/keto reductase [Pseudacidovorax intermedius]RDI19037.1 aryl-alcohol dehydrogenase-like predicted oxidoreductase [Pseudacidovorax intermedius]
MTIGPDPSAPLGVTPRQLAARKVFPIGLGCMGMSEFYGASDDAESLSTLRAAVDLGVQHFDTADTYGFGHNESLLGRFLNNLAPDERQHLTVATKFGIVREPGRYERRIDNTPAYIRSACEASLRRLGTDCIDLYYCHRRDPAVPIEDVAGAMAGLVAEGKVRAIGFSEIGADSLRRAHAVHPVAALQSEFSLWERQLERELLPLTQQLGIALVAYSPLGRGMLTGALPAASELEEGDFRRALPRFNGEAAEANRRQVETLRMLAEQWGAPATQLALAWTLHRGPHVLPIPGARRQTHLAQNIGAAGVSLDRAQLETLDRLFAPGSTAGARYPDAGWAGIEDSGASPR